MRYVENSLNNGKKLTTALLLALVFCGIVFGVYLVWQHPNWELLHNKYISQGFIVESTSKTLLQVFLNAFSWTCYSLLIVYLSGYSAIGHPISLMLMLLRGIALGISMCMLYLDYRLKGILIFISLVMVHAVASTVVLAFATITSITQSTKIACTILGRSSDMIFLKRYNMRFLLYAIVVLISSIVDTILTYTFYNVLI